jgi:hypothetical protein
VKSQLASETHAVVMETVFLVQINVCVTQVFSVVSVKIIVLSRTEQYAVGMAPAVTATPVPECARVRVDIY